MEVCPFDTVDINFALPDDSLLELLLIQWFTPVPQSTGEKIASPLPVAKGRLLTAVRKILAAEPVTDRPLLIIMPELSLPVSCKDAVDRILAEVNRPTIVVAGFEYLTWPEYVAFMNSSDTPNKEAWLSGGHDVQFVNLAGIWIRDAEGDTHLYLQPKRVPCDYEDGSLFCVSRLLFFKTNDQSSGRRFNFCVQVCSDLASEESVRSLRKGLSPMAFLDMTLLIQCNENQDAEHFRSAAKVYYEIPNDMVDTHRSCLLMVNNANPSFGSNGSWGQSKFLFRFQEKWRHLAAPYTYWLDDDPAFDHQAVVMRESGPSIYRLLYKPVYLVNRIPGTGNSKPLREVSHAFLTHNALGDFSPLPPVWHWMFSGLEEQINKLNMMLSTAQPTVRSFCQQQYEDTINIWRSAIGTNDQLAQQTIDTLFLCCRKSCQSNVEGPGNEREPKRWCSNSSHEFMLMMLVYALLNVGLSCGIRPTIYPLCHAVKDGIEFSFVSACRGLADNVVVEYLSRRSYPSSSGEVILVVINAAGSINLTVAKRLMERITRHMPSSFPPHFSPPGEVVRPSDFAPRLVCGDGLIGLLSLAESPYELVSHLEDAARKWELI